MNLFLSKMIEKFKKLKHHTTVTDLYDLHRAMTHGFEVLLEHHQNYTLRTYKEIKTLYGIPINGRTINYHLEFDNDKDKSEPPMVTKVLSIPTNDDLVSFIILKQEFYYSNCDKTKSSRIHYRYRFYKEIKHNGKTDIRPFLDFDDQTTSMPSNTLNMLFEIFHGFGSTLYKTKG